MTVGPSQSMNLGGKPTPYGDSFVALDLMKGADDWFYFAAAQTDVIVPPELLKFDERGWLTELPIINGVETPVYANVLYGKVLPEGQYILEWQGDGSVEVYQNYVQIAPNKLLITYEADYVGDDGQPKDDGFTVLLNSSDPNNTGNYVHDIKLYRLEDADLVAAGERFNPDWMDRVDDFRILRTHDWQETNFPSTVDWARNVFSADQARWGGNGAGMPYELLVDMANETRSDLWVNIPHTASDDYIRQAAIYIRDNLDPGLKLQVEFSNEYWTTIFDQYQYFLDGGARVYGATDFAAGRFYGDEAENMASIFEDVFGADSAILKPVLTVDDIMFKTGEAEAMLLAAGAREGGTSAEGAPDFDVIATDGYLSWYAPDDGTAAMIKDWMTDADGGFGRARDFLINQLNTELLPNWQKGRALADKYGLEFTVYEGGALLLNTEDNEDPILTDFANRFTKSAEMKQVYEAELAAWATVGTGPFSWYADVGRPGKYGDYGHWKGIDFVPDPRTTAITAANETTSPWWSGDSRPASTFVDGKYDAGTEGADRMVGTDLADRLYGLDGDDRLLGGAGNDVFWGGSGNDRIWGGIGNDTFNGGAGADTIQGEDGVDTITYAFSLQGVTVSLGTGRGSGGDAEGDRFRSVEVLIGSGLDDSLTGSKLGDTVDGGAGSDRINGAAGTDMLTGGQGDDQFVYANRIHGTDQITDFSNTAGNDDAFLFKSTVFGKLPIGVITDTAFQISTDAVATTGAIRFIYDTDDRGLYFDPDGSGSQQAILMVTLQEGAILTSADILIY
jgi:Ca2+-binding RTX toxin-like protein